MSTRLIVDQRSQLQEFRETGHQPQNLLIRVIAKIISYIFHPLFIPVYIAWFLISVQPYLFAGKSRNCKLLNNHFGVKGKNNLLKTKGIKTSYKQYPNGRASYVAFCKLMTRKKFYPKLKGKKDHTLWLDAISKAGYSTVPDEWKRNITAAIRKHKLAETD